jgi:hypothetical protein
MTSSVKHRLAALGSAALLAGSPVLLAPPADAAGLTCRASVSDSTPKQYTDVFVKVKTAPHAGVKTVAHYKTTKNTKNGKANSNGKASIKYYISGATPGYKVKVSVTVTKNGKSRSCSTAFTPHK